MIPKPEHGRRLGLSGVALTLSRNNRYEMRVLAEIRDQLEAIIDETKFLATAPFSWITICLRYGLKDDEKPSYGKINNKYGDLPLSIELDIRLFHKATYSEVRSKFLQAAVKALIHAGQRYDLPIEKLKNLLSQSQTD